MRQNLRSPAANMQRELLVIKRLVGRARILKPGWGCCKDVSMQKLCIIMPEGGATEDCSCHSVRHAYLVTAEN